MAQNDVIRITLRGTYGGEQWANVFHYKQTTVGALDLAAFRTAFDAAICLAIRTVTVTGLGIVSMLLEQLTEGGAYLEYYYDPIPNGTVNDEGLPPYACWTFTRIRTVRGHRNGYTRVSAVPETWQATGVAAPGHLDDLADCATALGQDITDAGAVVFRPGVLHRTSNGAPVVPPVFQESQDVIYSGIGTQNTRKIGRGI